MLTCCAVAAQLICGFIFAYAKSRFSWSDSFDKTLNQSTLQASGRLSYSRSRTNISRPQGNKPVQVTPPYTPPLYSKTGVYRGILYFLIFALKHRPWVLVRGEAVLTCTNDLCFEQN